MFDQRVRTQVRSAYQIQDLRIQTGNRIGANFRKKLGIDEGEEADEQQKDVLLRLKKSYDRITEGIAKITARRKYEYDGVISNYAELRLVDHFLHLVDEEKRIFRDIERGLEGLQIWDEFLEDVKGVGPAMAGCIVSELDPHKAPYPSSFFRYCGLDVVSIWKLRDFEWKNRVTGEDEPSLDLKEERDWVWKNNPEKKDENVFDNVKIHENGEGVVAICKKTVPGENGKPWRAEITYEQVTKGGRSRKREHLVDKEYESSDGEIKTRKSLGFNPFIKTKLMGVLAPSFLRATTGFYREFYYDYKHRLNHEDAHEDKTDGHKHMMAQRYMIKEFLKDLHIVWRYQEDLPVTKPYEVAKLGKDDHGREERLGIENPKRYGDR